MDRRRFINAAAATALAARFSPQALAQGRKKGVMLFDRLGMSSSALFIASADGSNERPFPENAVFDYHASFSADGRTVLFTGERNGLGEADIFMARSDGSDVRRLTTSPNVDDRAMLSPDGSTMAFVSTRGGYRANVWIQDVKTGRARNLTGAREVQGDPSKPDGFFCPSWSPDGKWLAFSSDRNTPWRGHDDAWEHTQELSIYIIGTDGHGFRQIATRPDYCLGSPRWSPDGRRVIFYEMTVAHTWHARRPDLVASAVSQLVSADVTTGQRFVHTSGPGLKLFPQFLSADEIAWHRKGGPDEGLYYTSDRPTLKRALRSPAWSPGGTQVIYEKVQFKPNFPQNTPFYSWDPDWDYQYSDSFPLLSRDGKLAIAQANVDGSIVIMNPDGSSKQTVFAPPAGGRGRASQPSWSPDGQWISFGYGSWFYNRDTAKNVIMRVRRDGSGAEVLTDGKENAGFPSWSADGKEIVYRVFGEPAGLRIINLSDHRIRVLTNAGDNLPSWSPDGKRIVFTRNLGGANFDVFTIRPDGSELRKLTDSGANDGHAVWNADGRILYSSGMYGFKDEAALYDNTFQPYGSIFVMNADGSGKKILTDSPWEDAQPVYAPYPSPR
jgi:Tol biopolymer transport system component